MRKIAHLIAAIGFGIAVISTSATAGHHESGDDKNMPKAEVYIISPADGDVVEGPVTIVFGLKGMGIAPAGVEHKNTGHHHLLIDRDTPTEEEMQEALPASDLLKHFGGGQTQTTLDLLPGTHTFQLIFADHNHVPFDPAIMSDKITITVVKADDDEGDDNDDDNDDGDDEDDKDDDKKGGGLLDRLF